MIFGISVAYNRFDRERTGGNLKGEGWLRINKPAFWAIALCMIQEPSPGILFYENRLMFIRF
jgi:hypothetical protein